MAGGPGAYVRSVLLDETVVDEVGGRAADVALDVLGARHLGCGLEHDDDRRLPERLVLWRHAFRPILVPLITVIGLSYAGLLETVFSWPGIGNYLTTALLNADMNAVLGSTLVIGAVFIGINKISDVLYRVLDPRAR